MQVSTCTVHLKPLAYCLPIEDDFALYRGVAAEGVLRVRAVPCRQDGTPIGDGDEEGPYDDVSVRNSKALMDLLFIEGRSALNWKRANDISRGS